MTNDSEDHPEPLFLSRKIRLRLLTIVTTTWVIYLSAAVFKLPGIREDFQVDPTIFGILTGAMLAVAGIEALSRLPGFSKKGDQ